MKTLAFGTPLLVRAEIARIVGAHSDAGYLFRQKPLDRRRYALYDFDDTVSPDTAWPGRAIPEDWAETPLGWEVEPSPNGRAVLRARRVMLATAQTGLYLGHIRLSEGTIAERSGKANQLVEQRRVDLYEVALTPLARGRARLTLVHPLDASEFPSTQLSA